MQNKNTIPKKQRKSPAAPRKPINSPAIGRITTLNNTFGAEGVLVIDNDFDSHTYIFGYRDLIVWNPRTNHWVMLPDKFYVTVNDPDIASAEFFGRWKNYIKQRFGVSYIPIKTLFVERN